MHTNTVTTNNFWDHWQMLDDSPSTWLEQLRLDGTLQRILPEVTVLFGIPQPEEHHPEIDTGVHTWMVVDQAWKLTHRHDIALAALLHDLGKGITPSANWPKHQEHEELGLTLVQDVCTRLNIPERVTKLSELVCSEHLRMHRSLETRFGNLIQWYDVHGFYENPNLLKDVLLACKADALGRKGFENRPYPQEAFVWDIYELSKPFMILQDRADQLKLQDAISNAKHAYTPANNKNARAEIAMRRVYQQTVNFSNVEQPR